MRQTLFLLLLGSSMVLAEDYTLNTRDPDLSGDISGYGSVTLSVQNSNESGGAAVVKDGKELNIKENGKVNLTGSNTSGSGGAIALASGAQLNITDNTGFVNISGNTAGAPAGGGAIALASGAQLNITSNTEGINISNNKADSYGQGGAIAVGSGAQLNIIDNTGHVNISHNTAGGSGGALIGLQKNSPITINNNGGGVTISNNSSKQYGGAIHASGALTISNNGKVSITGNASNHTSDSYCGGAISQRTREGSFTIVGNDYVEFKGNYSVKLNKEGKTETAKLNAIHQEYTTQKNTISAKTGGKVVFYDPITCEDTQGNASYELNADYTDRNKETVAAKGCITFSSKHAAEDLLKFGSAADLTASLTSTLLASTTLHNGTLSIEDGAILQTQALTLKAGTRACLNLQNGKLDTTEYSATFGTGSQIRAKGVNAITSAAITIADDSVITLDLTGATADSTILTLAASKGLTLGSHLTLNIVGTDGLAAGNYNLLQCDVDISKISTINGAAPSSLTWKQGVLSLALAPEPATTTLSLLALAGLAARRRRK